MKKRNRTFFAIIILGIIVVVGFISFQDKNIEPVILTQNDSVEFLTIDQKIVGSEIILVGEVNSLLPTKWLAPKGVKTDNPSPEEVFKSGGLFTDALFSVEQVLKGTYDKPVVRVRTFIGETEQVHWVNSGQPSFKNRKVYLLFLVKDIGPTAVVDEGDYVSVNSRYAVYEIIDGKAISGDDEWVLEELIAYIQNSVSQTP